MADRPALTEEERNFVEEMGLLYERMGQPRIPGLIMGYLLICDPPHQTTGQIQHALDVSAGSVSTLVRKLEEFEFLERAVVPGSRSKHYRIKEGAWPKLMASRMHAITDLRRLAERGLSLMPKGSVKRATRLREFREFYGHMEREMPKVLRRWHRTRSERGS